MKDTLKTKIILFCILFLAGALRFYGINWDSGFHMHPDERAIVIAVDKLNFPDNITEFFSPESPWNPKFFAYGSMPFYLLRFTGNIMSVLNPLFGTYDQINIVGRFLSGFIDLLTIVFLFKIGKKIFNKQTGLIGSFFYAVAVLPIQLSHFFAVDTFLTFFITVTLYVLIVFYEKPNIKSSLIVGLVFGTALATKISAFILIVPVMISILFSVLKNNKKNKIKKIIKYTLISLPLAVVVFVLFEPYALIDFKTFWEQTTLQSIMTKDPFIFPYTLQFVGKTPYIYELKNIFLWGLGPIIATLSFAGIIFIVKSFFTKTNNETLEQWSNEIIILFSFFIPYFLVIGSFAVGFMRYMIPLYPLFCLFAGFAVYKLTKNIKPNIKLITYYLLLVTSLIWPLSFIQIYNKANTRITATNWVLQNIPAGKAIATEHWDDTLPIVDGQRYKNFTLPLYDYDNDEKWIEINKTLEQTDYIIIASNRLYVPLQKLTACDKLPSFKCYPRTAKYYKDLFSENLGFEKVAEFVSFPTVPVLNIKINDQSADENFTVFDHPKIMIFKKTTNI